MIPVFINVRDRFTTTRALADFCAGLPGAVVHLVDNASTYGPLLDWYATCGHTVHRIENLGPRAAWTVLRDHLADARHYVVTDCDLAFDECPADLLGELAAKLDRSPELVKAGVALRIDDLPDTPIGRTARQMEAGHWGEPTIERDCVWYSAPIDTTFAMYRAAEGFGNYDPAVRLAGPYAARHVPWYYDAGNLPADERYYLDHMQHANALFYSPRVKREQGCD